MKKFLSLGIMACLILSLTVPVYAAEIESTNDNSDYETHWIIKDGEFQQISEEEYVELLKPKYYSFSEADSGETIAPMSTVSETYTRKSVSTYYGTIQPVSAWALYPAFPFAATSITTYASHSTTVSAEIKAKIRSSITAKLGVTVKESSGSASGNIGGSLGQAKPGMYARIRFQPKMVNISGTVRKVTLYNNAEKVDTFDVTSKYPVTLPNGITDGIYTVQYSSRPS